MTDLTPEPILAVESTELRLALSQLQTTSDDWKRRCEAAELKVAQLEAELRGAVAGAAAEE